MNDDTRICLAHGRDQRGAMKDIDNDRVGSDRLYLSGFPGIAGRSENFVPCLDQHREELSADGAGRACNKNGSVRARRLAHGSNSFQRKSESLTVKRNRLTGANVISRGLVRKSHKWH